MHLEVYEGRGAKEEEQRIPKRAQILSDCKATYTLETLQETKLIVRDARGTSFADLSPPFSEDNQVLSSFKVCQKHHASFMKIENMRDIFQRVRQNITKEP